MLATVALLLALATGSPDVEWGPHGSDALRGARVELELIAGRIEELKVRHRAGEAVDRELERLLVRGQELAGLLERAEAARAVQPSQPEPEELRERADVLHDQADRLAAAAAVLDVKIADARRAADPGPLLARATVASRAPSASAPASPEAARLSALLAERARVGAELQRVRAAASALEGEAARLEAER